MIGDLQLETAEFTGAATASTCTRCRQPLGVQYYELNGSVICSRCRSRIERDRQGGSRFGRLAAASGLGLVVAALGTALWYGVRALTGYEFGLLAILVGLGVGGAVRLGSKGRGGWAYQALAMLLTYGSIVSTYVPDIVNALREQQGQESTVAPTARAGTAASDPARPTVVPVDAPAAAGEAAAPPERPSLARGFLALGLAVVFLMVLASIAPFIGGIQSVMGLIIIGIALYEAWKINKKIPLVVTGPYRLTSAPRPPASGA